MINVCSIIFFSRINWRLTCGVCDLENTRTAVVNRQLEREVIEVLSY